jgi:hypothetical protein
MAATRSGAVRGGVAAVTAERRALPPCCVGGRPSQNECSAGRTRYLRFEPVCGATAGDRGGLVWGPAATFNGYGCSLQEGHVRWRRPSRPHQAGCERAGRLGGRTPVKDWGLWEARMNGQRCCFVQTNGCKRTGPKAAESGSLIHGRHRAPYERPAAAGYIRDVVPSSNLFLRNPSSGPAARSVKGRHAWRRNLAQEMPVQAREPVDIDLVPKAMPISRKPAKRC